MKKKLVLEVANAVTYKKVDAYDYLCEFNEEGYECYILLEGTCDVIVPVLNNDPNFGNFNEDAPKLTKVALE